MQKKYKTPLEQRILDVISHTEILRTSEIRELFPQVNSKVLNNTISSLMSKGYLHSIRRGVYLTCPSGSLVLDDPLRIATLIEPGYLGFSTALRVHDLLDYEPFTLFIVTSRRSRHITLGEYELIYIAMGDRATGGSLKNGIWVSGLEKTFFDCFYRPDHAGGFQVITKALFEAPRIDWMHFRYYLERFASDPMCQRTGYVLETFRRITGRSVPSGLIRYLRSRVRYSARLVPSGPPGGSFSDRWKLIDNVDIKKALGWYEYDR